MTKAVGCLLALLVTVPVLAGYSVADLERIAAKDVVPEIRMAAGYALVGYYEATKTEAELLVLIEKGESEAIRMAAGLALGKLWIGAGKTKVFLMNEITENGSALVRGAAVPALLDFLIANNATSLEFLYTKGASDELQYAAAKAYFQKQRANFDRAKLEAICKDDTASAGYRKAAAEFLAGHYLFPPTTALSRAELEKQALEGENEYLRYAAAYALVNLLVSDSATDLHKKVASFFLDPKLSAEYKWAYAWTLGAKWAAGL